MNSLPPEPSAKDPISATFMRALMRYIRSSTLLNGPGYRLRRGPNGTTLELAAVRTASSAAVPAPRCFDLGRLPEEEGGGCCLDRCYWLDGNSLRVWLDGRINFELTDFVHPGSPLSPGEQYSADDRPWMLLDVDADPDECPLRGFKDGPDGWREMTAATREAAHRLIPLYKLTHQGGVAIDLRAMPRTLNFEMELT